MSYDYNDPRLPEDVRAALAEYQEARDHIMRRKEKLNAQMLEVAVVLQRMIIAGPAAEVPELVAQVRRDTERLLAANQKLEDDLSSRYADITA